MSIQELMNMPIKSFDPKKGLYVLEHPIYIESPMMRVGFIEEKFGNLYFKLEFTDIETNVKMRTFFKLIHALETSTYKRLCYLLNLRADTCNLSSQIYKKAGSKYDPLLTTKVPKDKKRRYFSATISNCNHNFFGFLKYSKRDYSILVKT